MAMISQYSTQALDVTIIPVTPFEQNCSLVICTTTRRAVLIDPGGDIPQLLKEIERQQAILEKILLTHGHLDHCSAAGQLAQQLNIPIEGPQRADQFWLNHLAQQMELYAFPQAPAVVPNRWLEDNDQVCFGNITLSVYHCPGHTPGHVVFFHPASKLAWVGDVLFSGSIGRTDFPLGNHADLIHSIRSKLFPLGDDVVFIPGHGPRSTFGTERMHNPYVSDRTINHHH